MDTMNGLPTHPLLAHLVAVLVPLTALLAVLVVLWPAARRRLGAAVLVAATATLLLIPLTTAAGGWLRQRVMMGGEVLMRGTPAEVRSDERVKRAYLGHDEGTEVAHA